MVTCKDCLHYDVCVIVEHSTNDDEDYLTEFGCEDFKDRNKYEEVKYGRWLPQILLGQRVWDCSECATLGSPSWKRCPVCERKMEGENNDGE